MGQFLGLLTAVVVFISWMSLVGSPHVIETVIGLVIAMIVGLFVYFKVRRW